MRLRQILRTLFVRFQCWIEHDATGPLEPDEFPPMLAMNLRDSAVQRLLMDAGIFPLHRCRRCGALVQWRRANGGWQAISEQEFSRVLANARMLRQTLHINKHLRDLK